MASALWLLFVSLIFWTPSAAVYATTRWPAYRRTPFAIIVPNIPEPA